MSQEKDKLLAHSLADFFNDPLHQNVLIQILDASRDRHVSLRLVDWICTTYSKEHRMLFPKSDGSIVDIHSSYKSHLRSYGKSRFDIFRRGKKTTMKCGDKELETTLAQLNFIRWLINHQVVDYLETHREELMHLQKQDTNDENPGESSSKKPTKRKKGYHLSNLQARVIFE